MKRTENAAKIVAAVMGAYLLYAADPAVAQGAFTRRSGGDSARPSTSDRTSSQNSPSLNRQNDNTTARPFPSFNGIPAPSGGFARPQGTPNPNFGSRPTWGIPAPNIRVPAPTGIPAPNITVPAPTGIPAPNGGFATPGGTNTPGSVVRPPFGIPAPSTNPMGGSLQRRSSGQSGGSNGVSVAKPFPSSGTSGAVTTPKPFPSSGVSVGSSAHKPFPSRPINGGSWSSGAKWPYYYGGVTTVVHLDDFGVTIFRGYYPHYRVGYSYLSPYRYYGCPPFIRSSYVVTSPYVYVNGRELSTFYPYDDGDRYYAANANRGRALRAALNDIRAYWEESDSRALRRHLLEDMAVAVYVDEQYAYSLRSPDLVALSSDALDRVSTQSFKFTNVRERSDGLVNAYAQHHYRIRENGQSGVATMRYTMAYLNGEWYVSALSLAADLAEQR